jgi:hypothetical protein
MIDYKSRIGENNLVYRLNKFSYNDAMKIHIELTWHIKRKYILMLN